MIRWCGVAAILSGVLFATWGAIHGVLAPSAYLDAGLAALAVVVPALFLVGLIGLRARCNGRGGWFAQAGFVLGFVGSTAGCLRGLEDLVGWYDAHVLGYSNSTARGLLLHPWIDWLPLLFVGLTLVGIVTVRTKALGALRALPLAMGTFGWAYLFTDPGGAIETRSGHVAFGLLFSLSWVALGSMLWYQRGAPNRDPISRRD